MRGGIGQRTVPHPELTVLLCSIVVLAADISPLDILTHIPLLAEEANCPYIVCPSSRIPLNSNRRH